MAKTKFLNKKSGRRGGGLAISAIVELNETAVQKQLITPIKKTTDFFNSKGPGIVREAMKQALGEEPGGGLGAYAKTITASLFPGEKRPFGTPKAGSGIGVKLTEKEWEININALSRNLYHAFGRDGFYTWRTISVGRDSFVIPRRDKAYVFRVKDDDPRASSKYQATGNNVYQNKVEPSRGGNSIRFVGGGPHHVSSVSASSNWIERAEVIAVQLLEEALGKI